MNVENMCYTKILFSGLADFSNFIVKLLNFYTLVIYHLKFFTINILFHPFGLICHIIICPVNQFLSIKDTFLKLFF
jgi:hypothetical protein